MKKNMSRKLKLSKETVSNLDERAMRDLHGGATWTVGCEETWDIICLTDPISYCMGVCISINVPCESEHTPCPAVAGPVVP